MRKQGNISILVLFVLAAASLLGILTMTFVQHMMKQTETVYSYYQSYYLAKAGLEFGLSQLPLRGIGFEYALDTGNSLLASNFLCAHKGCDMNFSLSGTSLELSQRFWEGTGCLSPFFLRSGQSLIFPLVKDRTSFSGAFGYDTSHFYQNLYPVIQSTHIVGSQESPLVVYGMLVISGSDLAQDGVFFQTGVFDTDGLRIFLKHFESYVQLPNITNMNISPYVLYFMISSLEKPISFCLASSQPLPTQQYYLKSLGRYRMISLGLEAIYRQPIPDFLMNTYSSYGGSE